MELNIKRLGGSYIRAIQCIDEVAMHCADEAINDLNKVYRIRAALLKYVRYTADAEDLA